MRILQVVTYISPDGAYGGPVRVALNQAKALTALGHDVVVAGAAGGFDGPLPTSYDGFPVRLFPGRKIVPVTGFAGLAAPGLLKWLPRALRGADIVHVHMSRDLVTLPAAAMAIRAEKPLVVQTHGMIDSTDKALAKPLDAFLTVPILKASSTVFHLTPREKSDLRSVARSNLATRLLPNGVKVPNEPSIEQIYGPTEQPEVLCLARVHEIKRPTAFIEAGVRLVRKCPQSRFTLLGPDEGEGHKVEEILRRSGAGDRVTWPGPIPPDQAVDRMRQASIFVLPSMSELYSMSTLEAMSLGLPVVITETSGLAPMVRESKAGIVCGMSLSALESAVKELLENPAKRINMGQNARKAVASKYSIDKLTKVMEAEYRESSMRTLLG